MKTKNKINIRLEFDKKTIERKLVEAVVEDAIANMKQPFGFLYRAKIEDVVAKIIKKEFPSEYKRLKEEVLRLVEDKKFIQNIMKKLIKEVVEEKLERVI